VDDESADAVMLFMALYLARPTPVERRAELLGFHD
jgi:hypothetical protein